MTSVGDQITRSWLLDQAALDGFAELSGDDNPIHVDAAYAATTPFERPVAHGMHLYALLMASLRERFLDVVISAQSLVFPAPTPVGAKVTVAMRVAALDEASGVVDVTGSVTREDGVEVCRSRTGLGRSPSSAEVTVADAPPEAPGLAAAAEPATATTRRTFSTVDLALYRDLTDDPGPADGWVPEPLLAGMVSRLLGTELPGWGTNYLKQDYRFGGGARPGQEITAAVRVARVRPRGLVDLYAQIAVGSGQVLAAGRSLVLAPPGAVAHHASRARNLAT